MGTSKLGNGVFVVINPIFVSCLVTMDCFENSDGTRGRDWYVYQISPLRRSVLDNQNTKTISFLILYR
jgi:hypothetical protein